MELLTTITLHPMDKIIDFDDINNLTEKILFYQTQEENEYLIENLYEVMKKMQIDTMFVLNKKEFERYIRETLPKWIEENSK